MFYKIYHFYEQRWPGKDPEIYAMCFVAIWLYFLCLFAVLMACNLAGTQLVAGSGERWLLLLPGLVFLVAGYAIWLNRDQYKRIINNKIFSELSGTAKGKRTITFLLLLPGLLLIIALLSKRTP